MATAELFPFTLTKINPLDPDIDVVTFVYDVDQIPPDPDLILDVDPDAFFTYSNGNLVRIDFANGDYKTYTYISNPGFVDDGLLNTLYDSVTATTKTFGYNVNDVLISIIVT